MRFHDPQWLWLLLLLIPWMLLRLGQARRVPALAMADAAQIAALPDTFRARCARHLPWLRLLILVLAILALARPQSVERESKVRSEGVDLFTVLDISTSMLAEDLPAEERKGEARKNRLAMAKEVLADFLRGRRGDRIGFIVFAARPYPAAPLTLDHGWLQGAVAGLQAGTIEDGTAIGDAILAALNRLRVKPANARTPALTQEQTPDQARSQAIILITDGRGNAGTVTPEQAAAAAKALGIHIHAIGIGSRGPAVIPTENPLGGTLYRPVRADLDEDTLRGIATITGGRYFKADDRDSLARVFRDIDQLEKRLIEQKVYFSYQELYTGFLYAVLSLGMAELILRATLLRKLP